MPTVWYILLAALGFGFVIFIHELGHYVFAKWAGVRVDVFSIGFGPKILKKQIGETEYALSLLPFGGYVKFLGQDDNPGAELPDAERMDPRDYRAKSAGWKALILLGGVLFNLISSYLILLGLALNGMPVTRAVAGDVQQIVVTSGGVEVPSPAERMGLRPGDRIHAINGEKIRSFDDIFTETVLNGREPLRFEVKRPGETAPRLLPESGEVKPVYSQAMGLPVTGIMPPDGDHVRAVASTSTAAAGDGPRLDERVVSIAGERLPPPGDEAALVGQEIHRKLLPWVGRKVTLGLEKDGVEREATFVYAGDARSPTLPGFPVVVDAVLAGSPALAAGVQPGDVIVEADGAGAPDQALLLQRIRQALAEDRPCRLALMRADGADWRRIELEITGRRLEDGRKQIGIKFRPLASGRIPALPLLSDGSVSPLAAAGLEPGDTVIDVVRASADALAADARIATGDVRVLAHRGGERVLVPLPAPAFEALGRTDTVPTLARWMGQKPRPRLLDQVLGTRVLTVDAGGGTALAPGFARLQPAESGKAAIDVDLRPLRDAAPGLLEALRVGDWIVAVAPVPGGHALELLRGVEGEPRALAYDPGIAFAFDREDVPYQVASVGEAFQLVNDTSYNMVVKSLQLIPRFFRSPEQGGIDPNKSLTGPVGMFRILKMKAEHFGFDSFLKFLALIGLNLFLVNLLPIPITDGGQLLILGIETAIRRPIPVRLRNLLQYAGFLLVVGLMLYVLGLDISRLLP